jgi:hypothetical protein
LFKVLAPSQIDACGWIASQVLERKMSVELPSPGDSIVSPLAATSRASTAVLPPEAPGKPIPVRAPDSSLGSVGQTVPTEALQRVASPPARLAQAQSHFTNHGLKNFFAVVRQNSKYDVDFDTGKVDRSNSWATVQGPRGWTDINTSHRGTSVEWSGRTHLNYTGGAHGRVSWPWENVKEDRRGFDNTWGGWAFTVRPADAGHRANEITFTLEVRDKVSGDQHEVDFPFLTSGPVQISEEGFLHFSGKLWTPEALENLITSKGYGLPVIEFEGGGE